MNTKNRIVLKSRLIKMGLKKSEVYQIMALDESYLDKLVAIGNDKGLLDALNYFLGKNLEKKSHNKKNYYLKLYGALKDDISTLEFNEGMKLLNESLEDYHLRLIYQILINDVTRNYGVSILGAKLLQYAQDELRATIAYNVLTNESLISLEVSKHIASLILDYYDDSLTYDDHMGAIAILLVTPKAKLKFMKTIGYLRQSLRVFISHPDESIHVNARNIDNILEELLKLGIISLEEDEKEKRGIPDYYGGLIRSK